MRHLINIPEEMRRLDQWCVASPDKIPYVLDGNNLVKAKVNQGPWMRFEHAISIASQFGVGVGFVLSHLDPFVCIDLDVKESDERRSCENDLRRYERIVDAFDSYAELSTSGKGVHIWVKGYDGVGHRRDGVELYSNNRFIICTGHHIDSIKYIVENNVINVVPIVTKPKPVEDRTELLKILVSEIGGRETSGAELVEISEKLTDEEIVDRASRADNAVKFNDLCNGDWLKYGYPSQSEADLSLMSMIAFYSESNEQCRRIFRMTALGKREKAVKNDRYLNYTLRAIRDQQALERSINIDLQIKSEELAKAKKEPANEESEEICYDELDFPPGVAGELARFIYSSSIRPVKEVSIISALGFLAGVCGKAFHIPQSGLNMYTILIARSAVGKEAMHSGISFVLNRIRSAIPRVSEFVTFIDFASGQSLQKFCAQTPSFVSVAGEWGRKLKRLAIEDSAGDGPMQSLRTTMTNLYQKSGPASVVGGIAYSNREQNVDSVSGVAYSMIGETTPGTFYESLTDSMMEDGFLSRFIVIEYNGARPLANKNPITVPDNQLTEQLCYIVEHSLNLLGRGQYVEVKYSPEVKAELDAYDERCDKKINSTDDESRRQLWNRAHLKVCRLSALLAVADNPANPIVYKHHLDWAMIVINKNISLLLNRIKSGDVGNSDATRDRKLMDIVSGYLKARDSELSRYGIDPKLREQGIIPRKYLQVRSQNFSCFYKSRLGANNAFKSTLDHMLDNGYLVEIDKKELWQSYKCIGKCYRIINIPKF